MMAALRGLDLAPRAVLRTVLVILAVAVTVWVLYLLRRPISWLIVAAFIAIALSGPVAGLSRHMPRGLAIAAVYGLLIALPLALAALLIPPVVSQAEELANDVPTYVEDVREFVEENDTLRDLNEDYNIVDKLEEEAAKLPGQIGNATEILSDIGVGIVNSIFAVFTILILSIFMTSSGARWIQDFLERQEPVRRERLRRAFDHIGIAIGNYVGGAIVQATIAGVMAFIVLSILGAPFAGPLALIVALFDLVPVVGATIAGLLVAIVMLFVNFPVGLIVWIVYAVLYQQLENYVIQPQIQRRAVAVEPLVILVAVLFGSTLFGVMGALLAIPAAASIQIAIREWIEYRRETEDGGDAAGGAPAVPAPDPA